MFDFLKKKIKKEEFPIYVYNTLTRKKELFKPVKAGNLSFYQCGPTVYWTQHIGNMRAMVMADLIDRTFQYFGYSVTFVRNYTDVGHLTGDNLGDADKGEDRMEIASKREHLSPKQISDKYIKIFENDVKELNTLSPNYKPRATETIKEIIEMVDIMLKKGFAYSTDLAIYFDVSKAKDYTKLSRQNLEENISGAGSADIEDPNKKNPVDFAVWFFKAGVHKNALQYWKSPFKSPLVKDGEGFPGWHIECSAMIRKLLGKTIDIHMGGIEHIPVHHTNEIAQSEAVNGVPLADYWVHNEWLVTNNSKMAKSEGTSFSLSELKEKGFDPLAFRFFLMQAHYRSRQNFTWDALKAAQNGYIHLTNIIRSLGNKKGTINNNFKKLFSEKIADDFNIPQGLAVLFEMLKSDISKEDKLATAIDFDRVLGLKLEEVKQEKTDAPEEIKKLINEREEARKSKNWVKSDELRSKLKDLGYELKDSTNGVEVKKI